VLPAMVKSKILQTERTAEYTIIISGSPTADASLYKLIESSARPKILITLYPLILSFPSRHIAGRLRVVHITTHVFQRSQKDYIALMRKLARIEYIYSKVYGESFAEPIKIERVEGGWNTLVFLLGVRSYLKNTTFTIHDICFHNIEHLESQEYLCASITKLASKKGIKPKARVYARSSKLARFFDKSKKHAKHLLKLAMLGTQLCSNSGCDTFIEKDLLVQLESDQANRRSSRDYFLSKLKKQNNYLTISLLCKDVKVTGINQARHIMIGKMDWRHFLRSVIMIFHFLAKTKLSRTFRLASPYNSFILNYYSSKSTINNSFWQYVSSSESKLVSLWGDGLLSEGKALYNILRNNKEVRYMSTSCDPFMWYEYAGLRIFTDCFIEGGSFSAISGSILSTLSNLRIHSLPANGISYVSRTLRPSKSMVTVFVDIPLSQNIPFHISPRDILNFNSLITILTRFSHTRLRFFVKAHPALNSVEAIKSTFPALCSVHESCFLDSKSDILQFFAPNDPMHCFISRNSTILARICNNSEDSALGICLSENRLSSQSIAFQSASVVSNSKQAFKLIFNHYSSFLC
jgi:hypothetical protein